MSNKAAIVTTAIFLALILAYLIELRVTRQLKRVHTLDTMGQIYVTLSKTLDNKRIETYDVASEAKKLFPSLKVTNNQILDSWGHPIGVSLKRVERGIEVTLSSLGRDGGAQSGEDIIQHYILFSDTNTPSRGL